MIRLFLILGRIILFSCLSIVIFSSCESKTNVIQYKHKYSLKKIADLPYQLYEASGLIFYDSLLWTFNDGGNESILFGIDMHSEDIIKLITVKNVVQTDWEDITQDSNYIYIGDIGNNYGVRDNLSVVRIPKSNISNLPDQEVDAELISFSYPDQTDFELNYRNTSFDCEALAFIDDSLVLFTKDWVFHNSSIYAIPKIPGNYVARKVGEINANGLITAADYNKTKHLLVLTGHNNNIPFIMVENHVDLKSINLHNFKKNSFPDFSDVKIEGAAFLGNTIFLISEGETSRQAIFEVKKK